MYKRQGRRVAGAGAQGEVGEGGEDGLFAVGGDADQPPVADGQQQGAVVVAAGQFAQDPVRGGRALQVGLGADGDGHGVAGGEPQAEAFGAFGEPAEVGAAVQQVVDEFPPVGLLLADGHPLGALVALGDGAQRGLGGGEHGVAGAPDLGGGDGGEAGEGLPGRAGGAEADADEVAQSVAGLGGALAEVAQPFQFGAAEQTAGAGHLGEQGQTVAGELAGDV